jgi:hypothetical protein
MNVNRVEFQASGSRFPPNEMETDFEILQLHQQRREMHEECHRAKGADERLGPGVVW